jgi:protoheme IX farnesyltransferase
MAVAGSEVSGASLSEGGSTHLEWPVLGPTAPSGLRAQLGALWELCKPKVTRLVLVTTFLGTVAAPGSVEWSTALAALGGTALVVAGANALNMLLEKDSDALMTRTRTRPLPTGRLSADAALLFGVLVSLLGLGVLAAWTTALAVGIAALALLSYVLVYTPFKRISSLSLLIGAVPGALPPAIGYAALTGTLDGLGLWLFLILFVWQVPHFLAISIFRRDEYSRAGLRVLPMECGVQFARVTAVGMSLALLLTSLMPTLLGIASLAYGVIALLSGLVFVGMAIRNLGRTSTDGSARALFFASMPHLVVLLGTLAFGAP